MKKHKLKRYIESNGTMTQRNDGDLYKVKDVEKAFARLRAIAMDPECLTDTANDIWGIVGTEGLDDS
jgi:hypothetical protein